VNKTKIDWCDMTWNPVSGCLYGCQYCYAKGIANRFGSHHEISDSLIAELTSPAYDFNKGKVELYPYDFTPTFHKYRLAEPVRKNKGVTIFVCSMADLFGDWIPNEWIKQVFETCERALQHRYLFLTKNPKKYTELEFKIPLPTSDKYWYGTTVNSSADFIPPCRAEQLARLKGCNKFLSIEPILDEMHGIALENLKFFQWVIVGAETGNRKDKVIPQKEWIIKIKERCEQEKIPIFMKESLRELMGQDFIQKYPW
jgi:protein gp37